MPLPETMTGIMFTEKGQAELQSEPTPTLQPGTVLCESLYTGLTNGTERNVLMGGNYCAGHPARCGYQNVGRILAVGDGVEGLAEGDVVFSGDFCQHTRWFAAPAGPESLIVKLPEAVDAQHAALFGVASVATHDVRRASVSIGQRVLVVGAGPIGQFTAQVARAAGAIVTVIDLNARRLEVARQLGAHRTVTVTADGPWDELCRDGRFDVVFEDSGGPVLDRIIEQAVAFRGTVVVIAGRDRVDYPFNAGQGAEVTIVQAGHFVRDDLEQLCRLVAEGAVNVGPVIQEVVPADEMVGVYERLRDEPASLFGTVFDWTQQPTT
jgi:2-desacetyl-2-hydroxyethyl bacteriochlorophyllide A dehydrogenase